MGNKPRIRFKGFTEDWEQRKLGEVVKSYSGGTPTASNKEYYGGNIPFIRSAEINSDTTELYITQKGLDNSSAKIVEKGTILYAMYGATSGEVGISKINGAINQAILAMIPLEYNSRIIAQYLRKNKESIIGKYLQGGQGNLSANIILELPIQLPGLEESNQIANFLESFDNIITLHQCKLEKLKLTKKALLQKLFPKNGKHIPEIRFKGFTDAWEQRKFSEITYLSGIKNKENKPYESYSISNEFGFIPQNEQFENGGTMKTADKSMYYIVTQNSFAYNPARINVGSIGYYDKPDNVIVSSLYEVFKTTEIVNDKFLWHWFKSNQFNHLIEKYQEGGVRLYFYYDKLCKGTIELPTIDEQNKISNLLESLDLYITLHQRKLERLQEVKKGLLQKMFV